MSVKNGTANIKLKTAVTLYFKCNDRYRTKKPINLQCLYSHTMMLARSRC
jgi:hypothetical protein